MRKKLGHAKYRHLLSIRIHLFFLSIPKYAMYIMEGGKKCCIQINGLKYILIYIHLLQYIRTKVSNGQSLKNIPFNLEDKKREKIATNI